MFGTTIIAVGELLVEFVSHQKGCALKTLTEYSGPYPSGAPAICIDQAARIGASSQIYGAVGVDNFGEALIDRLRSNGVETSGIARVEQKTTGVAFVSYFGDGRRTFIFHIDGTAADSLEPDSIALPPGPLIMHFSGSSLGNSKLRAAIEQTASAVLARGGKISCDPNARPELMGDPQVKAVITRLVEASTYLFPSSVDLEFLYPDLSEDDAIASLLESGAEIIALTRGEQGSIIYTTESQPVRLSGHTVEEVDPTGAGDCFCGTFLAMMVKGETIDVCGKYANAAGAIAVTRRGPMEGNSNLETIEAFIDNHPVKPVA